MKKLYIVGAGDLGREIESWLDLYSADKEQVNIAGYLDDNPEALTNFPSDYKIVGAISGFNFHDDDWIILAVADPSTRERIRLSIPEKVRMYTFVARNAIIGKNVEIGEGSIVLPNSIISSNVMIGKFSIINIGTQLGHDVIIDDYCSLMPSVNLGGGVKLGKRVFVGTNATVIPKVSIGDDVKIGAGSTVITKILKSQTVFGNPAKRISSR